jgi:O-antigen/teichoic acid export membrane protein
VVRLSGFLTLALLTRMLAPEEFGAVAAASVLLPFIMLLADLGLSTYIVQTDGLDSTTLSTGFWFSAAAGAVLSGSMVAAAPVLAAALNTPGAAEIMAGMAVSVLFVVLGAVPSALLRRRMQFKSLAAQAAIASVAAQIVAVVLALAGAGAWALVAQSLVLQVLSCAMAWRAARWRPGGEFSGRTFRTMATFGSKVLTVEAAAAARALGEVAIISNALGAAALGYISIAQRLVQVAQDVGASALAPVSTVAFAKVRSSPERLRSGYTRALRIGYAAVSPVLVVVAVGAPLIVPILFGPGWGASERVAQALAVAAILVMGAMIDHGLHYGVGAPGRWLAYALVIDALTLGATFFLAPLGLDYVALGFVVVALAATVVRWVLVGRLIGVRPILLARDFAVDMVPVLASAAAGLAVRQLSDPLTDLAGIVLTAASIAVTHVVAVRMVNRGVLLDIWDALPIPSRLAGLRRLL